MRLHFESPKLCLSRVTFIKCRKKPLANVDYIGLLSGFRKRQDPVDPVDLYLIENLVLHEGLSPWIVQPSIPKLLV